MTAPLDKVAEEARAKAEALAAIETEARRVVHAAAAEWSPGAVRLLAALVMVGQPRELLTAARVDTLAGAEGRQGPRVELPATTLTQEAHGVALSMWRLFDVLVHRGRHLGPPGSVHDSLNALDNVGPRAGWR